MTEIKLIILINILFILNMFAYTFKSNKFTIFIIQPIFIDDDIVFIYAKA